MLVSALSFLGVIATLIWQAAAWTRSGRWSWISLGDLLLRPAADPGQQAAQGRLTDLATMPLAGAFLTFGIIVPVILLLIGIRVATLRDR